MRAIVPCSVVLLAYPAAAAAPVSYQLPEETAALAPGPDHDVAAANCSGCHSADYISTQPRALPNPTAFWTAEVVKMQKAYGAPIDDADVGKIVAYLVATYAKPGS
jgi:cytochrome c553